MLRSSRVGSVQVEAARREEAVVAAAELPTASARAAAAASPSAWAPATSTSMSSDPSLSVTLNDVPASTATHLTVAELYAEAKGRLLALAREAAPPEVGPGPRLEVRAAAREAGATASPRQPRPRRRS